MKKRALALILSALLTLHATACMRGPDDRDLPDDTSNTQQSDTDTQQVTSDATSFVPPTPDPTVQPPFAPTENEFPYPAPGQTIEDMLAENNQYDAWLTQALAQDLSPIDKIYGEYRRLWCEEMVFTIEMAERLFESPEAYEQWKAHLEEWMTVTVDMCRDEMPYVMSAMERYDIMAKNCALIRQKVIDTKLFCYHYEFRRVLGYYEDLAKFASLRWSYEPDTYHVQTDFDFANAPPKG